jgi:hypothetical protein
VNIDELTGKELGIVVAKEVMGWTEWLGTDDYEGSHPMFCDWGEDWGLTVYEDDESGDFAYHWAPWRSMDDAWKVVEAMRQMQYGFFLNQLGQAEWRATFGRISFEDGDAFGETANEAILRAALKAVEVK